MSTRINISLPPALHAAGKAAAANRGRSLSALLQEGLARMLDGATGADAAQIADLRQQIDQLRATIDQQQRFIDTLLALVQPQLPGNARPSPGKPVSRSAAAG